MKIPTKQIIDQAAHTIAGLVIIIAVLGLPFPLGGLLGGAAIGYVREVTEQGVITKNSLFHISQRSRLDIIFWALGGLIAACLIHFN